MLVTSREKSLQEQIGELQAKVQILEGDRKAFLEISQVTIRKNREKIIEYRRELTDLRKHYSCSIICDQITIYEAFENHEEDVNMFRNKPTVEVIKIMDNRKCDWIKKLNAAKYQTEKFQRDLVSIQEKYKSMVNVLGDPNSPGDRGLLEERRHELETRLDKTLLKLSEAENMNRTYEQILAQIRQDCGNYNRLMSETESILLKNREEFRELQQMNKDAELSRDAAKADMQKQEEQINFEKKEREKILLSLKKEMEEKKNIQERIDRRMQGKSSIAIEAEEVSDVKVQHIDDIEKKICTFEEAFKKIRETTGVTSTDEVIERFRTQCETQKRLQELKAENQEYLTQLTEKKTALLDEFENMKFLGESKLANGQKILRDLTQKFEEKENEKIQLQRELDEFMSVLVDIKIAIEHIYSKVSHLGSNTYTYAEDPLLKEVDDTYTLKLLKACEDKIQFLLSEVSVSRIGAVEKEMNEIEFQSIMLDRIPQSNLRIKLPCENRDSTGEEEEESAEEDGIMTRVQIKKQAQQLVDAKLHRRGQKKKQPNRSAKSRNL